MRVIGGQYEWNDINFSLCFYLFLGRIYIAWSFRNRFQKNTLRTFSYDVNSFFKSYVVIVGSFPDRQLDMSRETRRKIISLALFGNFDTKVMPNPNVLCLTFLRCTHIIKLLSNFLPPCLRLRALHRPSVPHHSQDRTVLDLWMFQQMSSSSARAVANPSTSIFLLMRSVTVSNSSLSIKP